MRIVNNPREPVGCAGDRHVAPGSVMTPSGEAWATSSGGSGQRLRAGVVGLGHYHVTGWVETLEGFSDELEIVALHDPDPERGRTLAPVHRDPSLRPGLGEAYRAVPFETDLDRLIADHDLDIALVTLPNAEAPAAIERLAAAGIHLLVDKPGARSAAELLPAVAAVRAAGVRVVVGLTRRYAPAARAARELIATGGLGHLLAAEASFATSSVAVRDPDNLLFDAERSGGGVLSWLGVHDVDALLWLSGEPVTEVIAMTGSVGHPGLGVEDVATVGLRFAGGAVGTIHGGYDLPARGYRGRLALRGLERSVELTGEDSLTVLRRGDDGVLDESSQTFPVTPAAGYGVTGRAAVADLLGAIRDGRETDAPIEALEQALQVIDAAYRSARTGRLVRLDGS
jgi:UDP-N-acetyl-2-amino-2-deoxyglucuronate dehydrogenase